MIRQFREASAVAIVAAVLASCGADDDTPMLAGDTRASAEKGEVLYRKAKQADDAGKSKRAVKLYDRVATSYPFAPSADEARYRQAQLLEQRGDIPEAFEAYDRFLQRYPGSNLYPMVIERQASMAQAAADGDIRSSVLGLKTKLSLDKTVDMLRKVASHAPRSRTASKALFTIGELYAAKRKPKEAIEAYRQLVREQPDSPEAPEALFRTGVVLMEDAKRGNQNQANLDLAREAFQDYLIQYPGHARNGEARRLIAGLGESDLRRSYEIAEFYRRTGKPESAKVYYRDIIRRAPPGSELHGKAGARLNEIGG